MHPDHAGYEPRVQEEFARLVRQYKRLSAAGASQARVPAPPQERRRLRKKGLKGLATGGLVATLMIMALLGLWSAGGQSPSHQGATVFVASAGGRSAPTLVMLPARSVPTTDAFGPSPDIPLEYETLPPLPRASADDLAWLLGRQDDNDWLGFQHALPELFSPGNQMKPDPQPVPVEGAAARDRLAATRRHTYPAGPDFVQQAKRASRCIAPNQAAAGR